MKTDPFFNVLPEMRKNKMTLFLLCVGFGFFLHTNFCKAQSNSEERKHPAINKAEKYSDKSMPETTPFYKYLLASDLWIAGEIQNIRIKQIKDEEGEWPKHKKVEVKNDMGVKQTKTIYPAVASLWKKELMDPPKIFSLILDIKPKNIFLGNYEKKIISVHFAFGVTKKILNEFKSHFSGYFPKGSIKRGNLISILLKKTHSYQLVSRRVPQPLVGPDKLINTHLSIMKIIANRLKAYRKINEYIENINHLKPAQKKHLLTLAASSKDQLGKGYRTNEYMDSIRKLKSKLDDKDNDTEVWKAWWREEKDKYVSRCGTWISERRRQRINKFKQDKKTSAFKRVKYADETGVVAGKIKGLKFERIERSDHAQKQINKWRIRNDTWLPAYLNYSLSQQNIYSLTFKIKITDVFVSKKIRLKTGEMIWVRYQLGKDLLSLAPSYSGQLKRLGDEIVLSITSILNEQKHSRYYKIDNLAVLSEVKKFREPKIKRIKRSIKKYVQRK